LTARLQPDPKRASGSGPSSSSSLALPPRKAKPHHSKAQRFSSRCWLARRFPITLAQIIPLLEVVAAGNKHFAQAAAFLRTFKSNEYFPVRIQASGRVAAGGLGLGLGWGLPRLGWGAGLRVHGSVQCPFALHSPVPDA
jgi:hypothetical protein